MVKTVPHFLDCVLLGFLKGSPGVDGKFLRHDGDKIGDIVRVEEGRVRALERWLNAADFFHAGAETASRLEMEM